MASTSFRVPSACPAAITLRECSSHSNQGRSVLALSRRRRLPENRCAGQAAPALLECPPLVQGQLSQAELLQQLSTLET